MINLAKRLLKLIQKNLPGFRLRIKILQLCGYRIGKDTYIGEDLLIIDEPEDRGMVTIGDRVAVSPRITLVTSSYPNKSIIRPYSPVEHGPIIIEDDAWIGTGAIIFPNLTIGKGAIVAACALVTRNVPPYTIVVGIPARPIRKLSGPWDTVKPEDLSS
jgi:acetyltransferase-like isoleucine patch superfamily enzyme